MEEERDGKEEKKRKGGGESFLGQNTKEKTFKTRRHLLAIIPGPLGKLQGSVCRSLCSKAPVP